MCGIFAFIKKGQFTKEELKSTINNFNKIKHRGPDHTSTIKLTNDDHSVLLGFHRLAIIDPSASANVILNDNNVYLVCNGEIYNYHYLIDKYNLPVKTGSDCEVILQLYLKYPDRWNTLADELDGVFSFLLYDHNKEIFCTGRDRIGVRPMFVGSSIDNSAICFASEAKAIPFDNVQFYQPGLYRVQRLEFLAQGTSYQHLYTLHDSHSNISWECSKKVLFDLFTEAVRKRLVADRPIGFLVSGGLDSSLVAAVANELIHGPITTFSIGLKDSPDLLAARKVANHLHSSHHEVIITEQDITNAISDVVYTDETYDITTIRASIPMYLIAKYISEKTDVKVVFSGEGADELFGGYLYFHDAPDYQSFQNETIRLLEDLHNYDVLRSDRTISRWGLELRVPFLDCDLVDFVISMDPAHKMPVGDKIEKQILRDAFDDNCLPKDVLYRQKEAFSDGVGYNSVSAIKDYANKFPLEDVLIANDHTAIPKTAEARLYHELFRNHYNSKINLHTKYYWMPKWNDSVTDPSATVLVKHTGIVGRNGKPGPTGPTGPVVVGKPGPYGYSH